MFKGFMNKFRGKPIAYDEARRLANDKDVKVRLKLAKREDLVPEILYFLAEDTSPEVRRAIAKNISTPRQADLLLSRDDDDGVRFNLAEKIGQLIPGLNEAELDKVHELTHHVLDLLAKDQATRVRRILSETLKDIANAPPEVIRRLARDVELVVCAPVLEHSPVLSDEDLLEIITSTPVLGALSIISKRKNISEDISDAIYFSEDIDAIGVMLGNKSAQIREDTLDRIVESARDIEPWHKPLVGRPKLSRKAVLRLAEFVADSLLDTLALRADLGDNAAEAVREEFERRMEAAEGTRTREEGGPPEERAKKLFKQGQLDDKVIREACHSGDGVFVKTAMALRSGISLSTITKIFELSSVKGVVALCWKAELSMQTAVLVQKRIAKIPPREVQGSSDGEYPFTKDEMEWQLEFFQDSA
ncbi:hypothetical protein BEN30_00875 [Magnetovibrio blakemorei]|uniref:DUF2336 domain-containing protein n=2 Tax=Magnetovibrio blakemorei TaxID=28181 RepID=A0A1E5Q4G4_9PROT|nr:hypothetical protein BEN30_00875 [Magnetovibrio blakemorei]